MNSNPIVTEVHDSISSDLGRDGSVRPDFTLESSLSKGILAIAIVLSVVLLCGLALRYSVVLVSDRPRVSADKDINPGSRSSSERRDVLPNENEWIREQAREDDRELLRNRQDRLWQEESRQRPDKTAAYQLWYREVQEIEEQLAEAELIQSRLTPEQASQGPLAEGTVLWHRKQRLLELRSDAPPL